MHKEEINSNHNWALRHIGDLFPTRYDYGPETKATEAQVILLRLS